MIKSVKRLVPVLLVLALLLAGCASSGQTGEEEEASAPAGTALPAAEYASLLFDTSYVHTIDIVLPGDGAWDTFIANCEDQEYIECGVVIDGEQIDGAAIRAKGNSSLQRSRSTGKYSFKVEFDHFTEGGSYHGLDKLALNNLVVDDSCMRDYVVYRMMAQFGVAAPLCSYAFVTVNGEDWGFYLAVEAVEDAFLERNFGEDHGNLFKPDKTGGAGGGGGGGGRDSFSTIDDTKLYYIDNDPDSYPSIFGSAKTDMTRKEKLRLIDSLRKLNACEDLESAIDIDSILRYICAHTFTCNGDSYTGSSTHNYYLYEKDGQMTMIPWDYNEAFGDFGNGNIATAVNDPIDPPVPNGTIDQRPMVAWIFSSQEYTDRYHAVYTEFLDTICDSGFLADTIEQTRALIAPYVERDPRSFCTVDQFQAGVDELLLFFRLRAQSVRGQLEGTIPSTYEGQAADSSALIDSSALGSTGGSGEMGSHASRGASGESSRSASGESSRGASDETEQTASDETAQTEA